MNKEMINRLLTGVNPKIIDAGILLLRCNIGIILFVVGSGKVLGWFGGFGFHTTLQFYGKMGFSVLLTYLSSYTEFIGGFLLTIGFLTRPAAIAVLINMAVATIIMLPNGFLGPSGASYPFTFFVVDLIILLTGPMSLSLDSLIMKKAEPENLNWRSITEKN
jgi:putative oxidoreductase